MKRFLITGIEGFVGRHLAEAIVNNNEENFVTGTYLDKPAVPFPDRVMLRKMDIMSEESVSSVWNETGPYDGIFHLAGLSSVSYSWKFPARVMNVNTVGTLHLLEAIRRSQIATRFLLVSSVEVYETQSGKTADENSRTNPMNPYAISKLAAEQIVQVYGLTYDIPVFIARPVSHTGPGQSGHFAVADFCQQAISIKTEQGRDGFISAGNIDAKRDYCDVRDIVQAYVTLMLSARSGEVYNISTGRQIVLREIIEIIKKTLSLECEVKQDPLRIRAHDPDPMVMSSDKITALGWSPVYSVESTIQDMIQDYGKK